jgi:crotonobetainyl-CoA:carnitine CoA-transferase CaiB-like acyl-CoA transferase
MSFLSGYRVLDLTDERGLMAGRILADLGADVVQVEPPAGSPARRVAPHDGDQRSLFFDAYAANKRGVTADLETEDGRELIRRLAAGADFLIESYDPGYLAAHQLDWPALQAVNPALIHVSITAFGSTGPKANWAQSDLTVWAAGGPLDPHRDGDRPPVRISIPQAFLHASADAAAGALFAHHARLLTGRGQHVDISAQASLGIATLAHVLTAEVNDEGLSWNEPPPKRIDQSGSGSGTAPDQKKWRCADGYVEFHIGLGPAAGAFTSAFMKWMVDEGGMDASVLEIDWRTVPDQMRDGSFKEDDLDRVRRAVHDFLLTKTQLEVLRAATERKLLCVPIYTTADVSNSEQLAARGYWAELGAGDRRHRLPGQFAQVNTDAFNLQRPAPALGEHDAEVAADWSRPSTYQAAVSPAVAGDAPSAPLAGLKVLDLTWVVAGPVIGRALADFGATVVRVESSTRVETARHMPPFYTGKPGPENSSLYITWNSGKLGVSIDMSTEAGRDIVRRLAAWSDVVIEAFAPGQMKRWGLDYETLSAGRDDLIMLSTSIMGQTGPFSKLAGYGNVGAALSGFQDIVGWPDLPALGPFGPYTDYVGPRFSIVTLLAALDERRRTGQGCYIDVSQVEAGVYFQSPELADYAASGTVVHRNGNADRDYVPHGVYPCLDENGKERFVAIAARTDEDWQQLAMAMGRPDLATAGDLATVSGRRLQEPALDEAIAAWTSTMTCEAATEVLQAVGVPAHLSASSRDFCDDPQLAHRGHLIRLPHAVHGTVIVEGPRYQLSETPGRVTRAAPMFGEDNAHVLIDILGFSQDEVTKLTEEGVLR